MENIDREDIQIIARHSNWAEESVDMVLKKSIYNNKRSWFNFLRLFFISLGVSFTTAGIVFFFAYNWADLQRFVKMGLVEGLIIISTLVILFSRIKLDVKNIILTGASILVGVLFAVFGQVYQTGANAYDFFLAWTIFITIWVVVANFAPLWLVFITLINTTFILYTQQVAHDWSVVFVFTLLFIINAVFLISFLFSKYVSDEINSPIWFTNLLALATVSFSTIGIVTGIFDSNETSFLLLIVIAVVIYGLGIKYGLKEKRGFYLSIIPFSIIIIISALLIKISDGAGMFFLVSLFVIVSVTLVIKNLINLQRKWMN